MLPDWLGAYDLSMINRGEVRGLVFIEDMGYELKHLAVTVLIYR